MSLRSELKILHLGEGEGKLRHEGTEAQGHQESQPVGQTRVPEQWQQPGRFQVLPQSAVSCKKRTWSCRPQGLRVSLLHWTERNSQGTLGSKPASALG